MAAHRTVFASGEAESTDAAYVLAEKNLWEKIGRIPGAEVRNIQHSTATRTTQETGLNIESFKVENRAIPMVIVTLLAALTINPEGSKNV